MNFMQDLKNDHIKDEVKRFLKSKGFLVLAAFFMIFSLQYLKKRNQNIKTSQNVFKVLFEHDYVQMKGMQNKDGTVYTIPKFVLLSKLLSKDVNVFEKDLNKLLTDINDEHFGALSKIWFYFRHNKEMNFSSINSPWAILIKELKVINSQTSPTNMAMIPLLASKRVNIINPGVR